MNVNTSYAAMNDTGIFGLMTRAGCPPVAQPLRPRACRCVATNAFLSHPRMFALQDAEAPVTLLACAAPSHWQCTAAATCDAAAGPLR
jgi:hypothetical protein